VAQVAVFSQINTKHAVLTIVEC